ncbi:hypothetical protein Emed_004807 [Eimeria media]
MAKKNKGKGKRLTGSPEVLRFKGTVPFSLLEALAEAAPNIRMQLQAFLSPQQQQQRQQQQQQQHEEGLQQQLSQQQQQADLEQLRHFLHLIGRLADELKQQQRHQHRQDTKSNNNSSTTALEAAAGGPFGLPRLRRALAAAAAAATAAAAGDGCCVKASKPKDYRFLWMPELLQPQPQYNPTGYPLSTLLHARSLAAAAVAAAAGAAAADAAPAEEQTNLEGTLGAGAGDAEPAAAAADAAGALREQKQLPENAPAAAAGGGGDPHSGASQQDPDSSSSSSSGCSCCTRIDGVCLSLPLQIGESCVSFLEAFRSSSEAALELAASGVSSDFSGGLVGFLSSLKETLREVDGLWRAAEEELLKAIFAASNQQQKQLKALLEAEAQISECEAQEEFAAKRKAEESFVLCLLELMETIQPGWKDSDIPKDAIELAETVIFYALRLPPQHVDLCHQVIRLYLRGTLPHQHQQQRQKQQQQHKAQQQHKEQQQQE